MTRIKQKQNLNINCLDKKKKGICVYTMMPYSQDYYINQV